MIPECCSERPFDSGILGRPVWHLDDPGSASISVAAARREGVGLLFRRGVSEEGEGLLAAGFRHIESLVTYRMTLPERAEETDPGIRLAEPCDADAVADIARAAFHSDRWHADPAIPNDHADAFKAAWAHNDVTGRADATVLAIGNDGSIDGFNALLYRDETLVIDLIAVAPGRQGQGIGRRLMTAAASFGAGRFAFLSVGTQSTNAASIRLYASMGMSEFGRAETWHWTPERQALSGGT